MTDTAEEALAALARDLVEEIAAGRALELAGSPALDGSGLDELELADHQRDILELVNWVRPFQRVEKGRVQHVRSYQEQRKPGLGTGLEANELGKQGGWIPEQDWLKGEQEWKAKGEAAWKTHEWKGAKKPKTPEQVGDEVQTHTFDKLPDTGDYRKVSQHLDKATDHLLRRGEQSGQIDQDRGAKAYHELAQAHEHIVRKIVPHAQPEQYPDIAQHLQRIAGHMQDLDQAMGANPQSTRQLLGSGKEVMAHAGEARREQKQKQLENEHADFLPGHEVQEIKTGRVGTVVSAMPGNAPGYEHNRWYVHFPGGKSDSSYLGSQLVSTGAGDIAGQVSRAQFEAQWANKRVQLGKDKGTVVDAAPEEVWDQGAEEFLPPDPGVVLVRWDSARKGDEPAPVHVSALTLEQPPPKTGAAAVHPNLGGHLAMQPGDTVSGHAYAHVPRPFEAQPLDVSDQAFVKAHQEMMAARKAQETELRQQARQAAQDERLQNAALERQGISPSGTYVPLTDSQFAVHTRNVEKALTAAVNAGMATDQAYTLDGKGQVWEPDRAMAHAGIVKEYLDKQVNVPSQRAALFMGGLSGGGKSTLLKSHPDISLKDYAVVNPDDFKEELAKRGMVPPVEGLSPMESATLIHEESVHLANLAAAELQRRGKNLAFDVTMKSRAVAEPRIAALKGNGYHVTAVFVDVPVEVSARRVMARYRRQLEKYRQGTDPLGGRYVPESVIMAGEHEPGVSKARNTFDRLRPQFDRWELYDNKEGKAKLLEKSGPPKSSGISSVEDLMRAGTAKGYTGNTKVEPQSGVAASLEKAMASGQVSSELSPQQGATSEVRFVTFGDGSRWVMKDSNPRLNSVEELSAMVSGIVGAGAPGVAAKGDRLYHPFVDGKPGHQLSKAGQEAAYASPAGRKIGLLDLIIGIADRGLGNWISSPGGPVPIDNGSTFSDMHWNVQKIARHDPFAKRLISAPGTFSPGELARVRSQVAALRPEFLSRGLGEQFTQALARLDEYTGNTEALAREAEQGARRPAVVSGPAFEDAAEFATDILPGTAAVFDRARQAPTDAAARTVLEEAARMLDGASGRGASGRAAEAAARAVRKLIAAGTAKGYTGNTEKEARAAERGMAGD